MNIEHSATTDNGKTRDHNEDNFLVDKKLNLFVVADGMGGHAAGEVASSLCVRRVREAIAESREMISKFDSSDGKGRNDLLHMLEASVQGACQAIYELGERNPEQRGMGTTCSLLLLAGNRGFIAHVGDSRIYLSRHGQVHQLSDDHSLVNELVRRGKVKLEDIDSSPYRNYKNAVTRAVGVYQTVEVDTLDFDVLPGDQFIICSDGLHHYLTDESILDLLDKKDIKESPQAMIDFANAGGGHDNITSIVVRVGAAAEEDKRSTEVTLKLEVLKGMQLFRYLNYKELVRLMNITQMRRYGDGESIISEGDAGAEFFIILDGKVRLHKGDSFITSLKRGDHFGEMALVDSDVRSASASAQGSARTLVIHRRDFYEIIREESKLSVKLLWSFVRELTKRLRKTTADLSGARVDALIDATIPDLTAHVFKDD